ncbi:hypothetical protein C2G38_1618510 [Gigaspora rosea]|uniref:Uncharacterized protein n=1 Tax=Gigaspora rosea TaxID=44941 RepID=A0A397VZW0_9GLOM|nr:hypothetical protein C2G38_1618510 [Gigaspora rosea]
MTKVSKISLIFFILFIYLFFIKMHNFTVVIIGDELLKSSFHKKQEKIQKQIEQLEMENVADKDWTLMGEVIIFNILYVISEIFNHSRTSILFSDIRQT